MSRKAKAKKRQPPKPERIAELLNEMEAKGEHPSHGSEDAVRQWLQENSERELWFFSRWILGNDHLGRGTFHRDKVCPFLTDFSRNSMKLLMLPMGHLKTTITSRSMPLHAMIQPAAKNMYLPGRAGYNMRVLLANENEEKSKENLSVLKRHCEDNPWLPWLWPSVFWDDPRAESARWTDYSIELKRTAIYAEASISAVGIRTGFIGKYFDIIIADDIAALEAAQNPPTMQRAGNWRRAAKTRFPDKRRRLMVGVGTHWGANDIYIEWKKDPDFDVMIHSIVEFDDEKKVEVPLWPEQFPLDVIETMRKGSDPIEWALWYMNKPVPLGYTALNWSDVREYMVSPDGSEIYFYESEFDERINLRYKTITHNLGFTIGGQRYNPMNAAPRTKIPNTMDGDFVGHMRLKRGLCEQCGAPPGSNCGHQAEHNYGYRFLGQQR